LAFIIRKADPSPKGRARNGKKANGKIRDLREKVEPGCQTGGSSVHLHTKALIARQFVPTQNTGTMNP
jgi:hypothetical protein